MIHRYHTEFAKKYGLIEAVLLEYFLYWTDQNRSAGKMDNYKDGRWWTYNTMKKIAETFDYLSAWQVRSAIDNLVKSGALITGNFNTKGFDHTKWYSPSDEVIADLRNTTNRIEEYHKSNCEIPQIELRNTTNRIVEFHNAIPIKGQIIGQINRPIISNAREGEGINPRYQTEVIETFERSFGFINGQIAERLLTLLVDTGIEPLRKAMARAKTNGVSPRNAMSYIESTAQGIADGHDFAKPKNDVAGAAEELERKLNEGGNADDDSTSGSDSVWGIWGGQ